jgi:hypothetical protein
MSVPKANEIEIVGFNGEPLVECGRALPIAKRPSVGRYCVLDLSRGVDALVWYTKEEADRFAANRQWTELERSVSFPRACFDASTGDFTSQPMVVFENEMLLDVANRVPRPDHYDGQYLTWQAVKGERTGFFAACASGAAVEAILDDWADGLLARFDAIFRTTRDREDLRRSADFALCAARSRNLRWRCYLRYTATQEPDKVKRTFDRFIHPEFPDTSWNEFCVEMRAMKDVWEIQPTFSPVNDHRSNGKATGEKLRDIALETPLKLVTA